MRKGGGQPATLIPKSGGRSPGAKEKEKETPNETKSEKVERDTK